MSSVRAYVIAYVYSLSFGSLFVRRDPARGQVVRVKHIARVLTPQRRIVGATNPLESDPGSVRGQYAVSVGYVYLPLPTCPAPGKCRRIRGGILSAMHFQRPSARRYLHSTDDTAVT